jgi:hypothetical protein
VTSWRQLLETARVEHMRQYAEQNAEQNTASAQAELRTA